MKRSFDALRRSYGLRRAVGRNVSKYLEALRVFGAAHKPDNGIEEEEDISALEASDSRGISVRSPVLAIA